MNPCAVPSRSFLSRAHAPLTARLGTARYTLDFRSFLSLSLSLLFPVRFSILDSSTEQALLTKPLRLDDLTSPIAKEWIQQETRDRATSQTVAGGTRNPGPVARILHQQCQKANNTTIFSLIT